MKKRVSLMPLACKYARTHESEIFRVACLYSHLNLTFKETREAWNEWTAYHSDGEWPDWVEDICLDILAKRLFLLVDIPEVGEVYIVKPMQHLLPNEKWKRATPETWEEAQW